MLKVQHFAHFLLAERQTWILQRDLPMNNLHTCQPVRANDFPVAIAVVESSSYSWLVVKPLNFWGPYLVCSSVMGWAHKPDAICVGQTFISLGGDLQYCWCSLPAAFGQAWDSKSRNFPPFPVRVWWSYCWVHQLERQMRVRWRHWRNVAVSTRTVGAPRACFFGGTPMGLIWIYHGSYDDLCWFMTYRLRLRIPVNQPVDISARILFLGLTQPAKKLKVATDLAVRCGWGVHRSTSNSLMG